MNRPSLVILVALGSVVASMPAHARSCEEAMAQLERRLAPKLVAGTERQTLRAQRHREPTRKEVRAAERKAARQKREVDAALAHARRMEAEGRNSACLRALSKVKRLLP